MTLTNRKALERILFVTCLLLTSISNVKSIQEGVDYDRREELGVPKDLINKLHHSMVTDLKMDSDDGFYPKMAPLPQTLRYSILNNNNNNQNAHLELPGKSSTSKRDPRIHIRSASHVQTLRRIKNPCAGENMMSYSIGAPPTASTVSISPRDLLMTLGGEALRAQRVARNILQRFEAMGINRQKTVGVLGHASSMAFSRTLRRPYDLRHNTIVMLNDIYRQLARSALVLQEIVDDGGHFTSLVDNLKENGVYNLLCGIKVVMDAKDASFRQTGAAMLGKSSLAEAPSDAWRLARNYVVIHEVAAMLGEIGARLTVLSQYFS